MTTEPDYSPGGEIARTPIADAPQAIVAQARDTPELGTAGRCSNDVSRVRMAR